MQTLSGLEAEVVCDKLEWQPWRTSFLCSASVGRGMVFFVPCCFFFFCACGLVAARHSWLDDLDIFLMGKGRDVGREVCGSLFCFHVREAGKKGLMTWIRTFMMIKMEMLPGSDN